MIFALDSNIISDIIKEDDKIIKRLRHEMDAKNNFIIPPIVYYEVERGLLAKNLLKKKRAFDKFCTKVKIGTIDLATWKKAAQIYATLSKRGQLIGNKFDGDYLIAAFCLNGGYAIVSHNENHFNRVDGLKVVNWV